MVSQNTTLFQLVAVGLVGATVLGNPISNDFKKGPLEIPGLKFLGATGNKEFYISRAMKSNFQYALGFGCPIVFDPLSDNNLVLASVETREEVSILDSYFTTIQSDDPTAEPELVWTSGIDRLGNVKRQWASTGKEIDEYPTSFMGDWQAGQGSAPIVANYNCVAIWRYCNRQGHGPTIPRCTPAPMGTWFTPRPCNEERRFICERRV